MWDTTYNVIPTRKPKEKKKGKPKGTNYWFIQHEWILNILYKVKEEKIQKNPHQSFSVCALLTFWAE